jgi:hypothetical protein
MLTVGFSCTNDEVYDREETRGDTTMSENGAFYPRR